MNNEKKIAGRTLKLFPVKILRDHFEVKGLAHDDVVEAILDNAGLAAVKDFSWSHFNFTKQHIHIFSSELKKKTLPDLNDLKKFPFPILKVVDSIEGMHLFCLPEIKYKVVIGEPIEVVEVVFIQPFLVTITKENVIFRYTIMEKNMQFYFPKARPVYKSEKNLEEEMITQEVINFVHPWIEVQKEDLHKGIKHLWEIDVIDSRAAKWKSAKSVSSETMDKNYYIKKHMPDVYDKIIMSPLNKMIFEYLHNDGLLCDHFAIEPSKGEISIPTFPDKSEQIDNVIKKILTNNR